jgi:Secretion system C-terminal sorting domain
MKKILLLLTCLTTYFSNAQYFEGFESGFPGTMTETFLTATTSWTSCGGDTGGAVCPITGTASATFYQSNVNNAITALSTPVLDLSVGNYKLSFNHIQRIRAGKKNLLYAELSQNGGTSWTSIGNFFADIQFTKKEIINLPAGLSNTCMIRFRAVNKFGYAIVLDDISITPIQSNDASMISIALNPVLVTGNNVVAGVLRNTGSSVITSLDINWQADGGTIYTNSLTGLNLVANQLFNFSHTDLWNAPAGLHNLNVWVSNTNGGDLDNSNDLVIKSFSIASGTTTRFPLYEKFTSSTCPPCYTFDINFGPFYGINNDNLALINYQVNWPSTGDPYFTSEINTRRNYYGVTGVPNLFIDSIDKTDSATSVLNSNLSLSQSLPSYFGLNATFNIVGDDLTVNINTLPYLNGTYNLMVAVVEKITTGNATTNGETEFKNVMMKMMPDALGTIINTVHDVPINTVLTTNVANGTYINPTLTGAALNSSTNRIHTEDINDLEVIVFIQDKDDKTIMQAAKATTLLASRNFSEDSRFSIYPNPSTGIVKITSEKPIDLVIIDILSKIVFTTNNVINDSSIDLSNLQKGIYFAKITDGNKTTTQKLILK